MMPSRPVRKGREFLAELDENLGSWVPLTFSITYLNYFLTRRTWNIPFSTWATVTSLPSFTVTRSKIEVVKYTCSSLEIR